MTAVDPTYVSVPADRYPQLLRTSRSRWWRPLLGLLLAAAALAGASVVVILGALVVSAVTGGSGDPLSEASLSPDTPLGLLANNLVLAMLIPAVALAVIVVHRERAGWLTSVLGRPRWGLLWRSLALAAPIVLVFFAASFLIPDDSTADAASSPATGTLVALLAVILLTTPLQAAAEEIGFRGYLSQALASWFARPMLGTVVAGGVSAVLFAMAHGGQDLWLFTDRLSFGVVASWLVWRTGGLEAAVALHVANNLVSLAYSALTGSLSSALTASSLPWQFAVLDVGMMVVFAAAVAALTGRWGVAVRRAAPPGVLSGPAAVGYSDSRPPAPPPAGPDSPWGMG